MAKYTVRASETGAVRGDGEGTRSFTTKPIPPGRNVTVNSGRHAVGESLARPGTIPGGQGARRANGVGTGYNQKTGARPEMTGRPSIRSNQAETSLDAERRLLAAPDPFKFDNSTANMPTDRINGATLGIEYNVEAPVNAKPQTYGSKVMSDKEMMEAVGYGASDTKSDNPIINGYGGRKNPRESGMPGTRSKNASKREQAAVRQSPIKLY